MVGRLFSQKHANLSALTWDRRFPLRMAFFRDRMHAKLRFAWSRVNNLDVSLRSLRSLRSHLPTYPHSLEVRPFPTTIAIEPAAIDFNCRQPIPQIPPASLPSRKNAMRRGSEACDREKMPCAGEDARKPRKTPIALQGTHVWPTWPK